MLNQIDDPQKMQKLILKYTYLLAGIFSLLFLTQGEYEYFLGLLLGLVISTLILRLKFLHISRSLKMEEDKANKFIRNRYFIEYIIYFAVLMVAFNNTGVNFITTILGLFLMKLTILSWAVFNLLKKS